MRNVSAISPAVRALALSALLAAAALSVPPGGAGAAPVQDKPLQHAVTVSLKLVQVYVTGKGGKPAEDLTAEDFEVTDNGEIQTVTHFERHFVGLDEERTEPTSLPSTNRKFFLVFDFAFMDARGVVKSRDAGLKFLESEIQPTDEIGLVSYSTMRGLVLHEYLTTDHARIKQIVGGFGLQHHAGRAENLSDFVYASDVTEEQAWGGVTADSAGAGRGGAGQAAADAEFYQNQAQLRSGKAVDEGRRQGYVEQAQDFIIALGQLAKVLRYIPGFKNVVLFSGGIAKQVLFGKKGGAAVGEWTNPEELAAQLSAYDSAQADAALRSDFTQMLKEFKASNSPIFAVDATRTMREADVGLAEGATPDLRDVAGSDSLRQIASGTGGKFYANTVDNVTIAKDIQTTTGAYYVLGYSVSEKWDGKFHKIKVRVKRKGLDVLAQGGYFGPKPFKDYSPFEKLLHVIDLALSDTPQVQVPFSIEVAAMPVLVRGWPQLAAFGRASLAAHGEVLGKKAEAYILLFDRNNDLAYIKKFRMAIPETGKETFFPTFLLPVKSGPYSCRIVIRNMETGRGARGVVPVIMPASSSQTFSIDPPLLLVPDTKSLELEAASGDSLSGLFAYDENAYAPLLGDVPAGTGKIYAALRVSGGQLGTQMDVTAALVEANAQARKSVPVTVVRQSEDKGTRLVLVEIGAAGFGAGTHAIEFTVRESVTGASAVTTAAFKMK